MPEKFNIVRQCRHGLMVFNRHDQFIGKALKVYGEYSEGEYDVFSQVVKPGDTVIEAGANLDVRQGLVDADAKVPYS